MKKNTVKVTKTNNHSTLKEKPAKKPYVHFDDYFCMNSWRMKPVTDEWIDNLAQKMVTWAREEDSLKITQFYSLNGLNTKDMVRWLDRSESLRRAHEQTLSLLGDRREIGGLKKKFDTSIIVHTMPHYDQSWRMLAEWRAKLKAEAEQQQTGPQIVVIEKFPDSVVDRKETTQISESDNFEHEDSNKK